MVNRSKTKRVVRVRRSRPDDHADQSAVRRRNDRFVRKCPLAPVPGGAREKGRDDAHIACSVVVLRLPAGARKYDITGIRAGKNCPLRGARRVGGEARIELVSHPRARKVRHTGFYLFVLLRNLPHRRRRHCEVHAGQSVVGHFRREDLRAPACELVHFGTFRRDDLPDITGKPRCNYNFRHNCGDCIFCTTI